MDSETDRRRAVARLALLGVTIAAAFLAVTLAGIGPSDAQRWVAGAGAAGPIVFVLAGGALGFALFPGHVTATLAGVLFGAVAGTGLALAATLLAAGLALLTARRLGADALRSLIGPRARRWQAWLAAHGFAAILTSRLAPGMPAGVINYLAGLAGIRPRAFFAAVALGALPKTIAYVALGGALADPISARGAFAVALYAGAAAGGALVARRLVRARPHHSSTRDDARSSPGGEDRPPERAVAVGTEQSRDVTHRRKQLLEQEPLVAVRITPLRSNPATFE